MSLIFCCTLSRSALAGTPRAVDERDRIVLDGNVSPLAQPRFETGRTDPNLPMERIILSLGLRAGAQARLERLLAQQHDPASPLYHRWLTPEEFGARFGLRDEDLGRITDWLQEHGFTIDEVAKGRGWINFSGTAAQVEEAFATEMHDYVVEGKLRHANAADPSIPRAFSGVVNGIVSLHNFPLRSSHGNVRPVTREDLALKYSGGTNHYVAPADFATIFDLNPAYSAGINGTGRTIAIVGRSDLQLSDVQFFRSFFGLPANDPVIIHNGPAPGILGGLEELEADLDVEWSGAVARNATVKFVVSKTTTSTDGVLLSIQYIVNNNVGDVMSTSFLQCESSLGSTGRAFYNSQWSQAASQGITSFVSSGDSGAAGCNVGGDTTGSGVAVSGLCSTPYNVCVGGSLLNEAGNPSAYWSPTNNPETQGSALSYIPEVAWNESSNVTGGTGLWATGGGPSAVYTKPSWQVAPGVPNDNRRYIPDVSLPAAGHDGYLVIQGHTASNFGLWSMYGTSASSPAFAGVMSLVVQKTGARQGNANTVFYPLAASQYGGTGPAIFHDVTSGNNSVPGVTGFTCTPGYDQVTGLGSVDGTALINNWPAPTVPSFTLGVTPAAVSVVRGSSGSATVATAVSGGFNSAIALSASGQPSGVTVTFSPASIPAPGSGLSTAAFAVAAATAPGSYPITVTAAGGGITRTATITLTVTEAAGFTLFALPTTVSLVQGGTGGSSIATTTSGGFNSAIGLSASGQPAGVTVIFTPASIAAPGAGSSTMAISVGFTTASGSYPITVTATGGGVTRTATVVLTVSEVPGFTLAASPAVLSVGSGGSVTATVSSATSGGFNNAVALSASGQPAGVTVTFSPASIAAPGSGSATATFAVSLTAAAGSYPITITGIGGSLLRTATITLNVSAVASFVLAAAPPGLYVAQGSAGSTTVVTAVSGGFNSALALSASGQPAGVAVTFSPASIAAPGAGAASATFAVGAGTPAGSYPVTVTATGGGVTRTTTVTLAVYALPSLSVSVSPAALTLMKGTSGTATLTTSVVGGFTGNIAVWATGQPSGVSVSFNPSNVPAGTSTITFAVGTNASAGTYPIAIHANTGSTGGGSRTTVVTLTVIPIPSFTLDVAPSEISVMQGSTGLTTVSTAVSGGLSGPIALSASSLPPGVTVSFSPPFIAGAGSSTALFSVPSTTPTGRYGITITGNGGPVAGTRTFTLYFTVTAVPDFTIATTPTAVSVAQGSSGTTTAVTGVSGGFYDSVALSATGQPAGVTVTFNPTYIAAQGAGTSTVTFSVGAATVAGTYPILVTGTGGGVTHTTTFMLTVTETPRFIAGVSPAAVSVVRGNAVTATLVTAIAGGFNRSILLRASGQPSGVTVSFNPATIAAPGTGFSIVTFSVAATTTPGTYPITLTAEGSSGGGTRTAVVTLVVSNSL